MAPSRSSRPEVFCKKGALRNFTKFTGKHLRPKACNFIKKETLAQVLSCEFCEISKKTFFTLNTITPHYSKTNCKNFIIIYFSKSLFQS